MAEQLNWYAQMRQTTPVYHSGDGAWDIFGYDDVRTALSDYANFSSARGRARGGGSNVLGESLISTDPPRHRQLRSLVDKAFTPRAVQALGPRIEQITSELLDQFTGHELDFVRAFAEPLPVQVIAEILGVPLEDRRDFKRWSDAVVTGNPAGTREMAIYFKRLIDRRRTEGVTGSDMISVLMEVEQDGEHLSENELLGFCVLLLVAGNETTTNLLANSVQIFSDQPDVREELVADPTLWPGAIEEALRFHSPVQSMFRVTTHDISLSGQVIPENSFVRAWIGSANRDETKFPNPDTFDPRRNPNRHLAFGVGIHFCLGAPLARLEAQTALPELYRRFPNLRVNNDQPISYLESTIVHGPKALPVRW